MLAGTGCDALFGLDKVPDITSVDTCAFASVATGRDHTCAIDGANRLWCWGLNDSGQIDDSGERSVLVPRQITLAASRGRPVQVGAGRAFTCVRFDSGNVACWGANESGQLGTGPDGVTVNAGITDVPIGEPVSDLGVGADYACALRASDRSVVCWGSNSMLSLGRTDVQTAGLPTVIAGTEGTKRLAVGHRHNCIVDALDGVKCWGRGGAQQVGMTAADTATPVAITGVAPVNDVSVGGRTSCALEMSGAVRCWGSGRDGQLGNGTFNVTSYPPTTTPAVTDALVLQVGSMGACTLRDNSRDNLACWGLSDAGSGAATAGASPRTSTLEGAAGLVHRFHHTCVTVGKELLCWGANQEGQLGRGTRSSAPTPTDVPGIANATRVAVGLRTTCAVASGQLACWGSAEYGQLGDGTLRTAYAPVMIDPSLSSITGIASGAYHTCAWRATAARCWGIDDYGQVGNGTQTRHVSLPALVTNLNDVVGMAVGGYHTCAFSSLGAMKCWGRNHVGQLGIGTMTASATPATVVIGAVSAIAAGAAHTCAISNSAVYCWGYNNLGQLGLGTTASTTTPTTQTVLPSAPAQIATGGFHTCAVLNTGALYCWGSNVRGQLGVGDRDVRLSPVAISLPASVSAIALGGDSTCAQLVDGRVFCWGAGTRDQLGNGATADALSPVEIPQLAGVTNLVRSSTGGCAIRSTGTVTCWGDSLHLGNGDNSTSVPAVVPLSCR